MVLPCNTASSEKPLPLRAFQMSPVSLRPQNMNLQPTDVTLLLKIKPFLRILETPFRDSMNEGTCPTPLQNPSEGGIIREQALVGTLHSKGTLCILTVASPDDKTLGFSPLLIAQFAKNKIKIKNQTNPNQNTNNNKKPR